jgi:hypothetical protein
MAAKNHNKANGVVKGNRTEGTETSGVFFLSLSLENVRCFGPKQTLEMSDGNGKPAQWTILLGNNGTGKTTILQMLVGFRPWGQPRDPEDMRAYWGVSNRLMRLLRNEQTTFRLSARVAEGPGLSTANEGSPGKEYRVEFTESASFDPNPSPHTPMPRCYAYGAGRRLSFKSLSDTDQIGDTDSLFDENAPLRNAEEWLLKLDYSAAAAKSSEVRELQQRRLRQVTELLIKILPETSDICIKESTGVLPSPRVEFETPYGWVPLRQLGFGYQTLIAWMVDFASRMVERYPDSPDPLAEPAVVLVDEIDLHLHPTWQRRLIGYLTERFPNTQFIATAHSPLIVQAAAGANLAVLRREGDHVVIDNDVDAIRNWRIDQILTSELFGLPSARPPELDDLLAKRKTLLTKATLTTADKRELTRLEKQIGDLPAGESAAQAKELALLKETLDHLKRHSEPRP